MKYGAACWKRKCNMVWYKMFPSFLSIFQRWQLYLLRAASLPHLAGKLPSACLWMSMTLCLPFFGWKEYRSKVQSCHLHFTQTLNRQEPPISAPTRAEDFPMCVNPLRLSQDGSKGLTLMAKLQQSRADFLSLWGEAVLNAAVGVFTTLSFRIS